MQRQPQPQQMARRCGITLVGSARVQDRPVRQPLDVARYEVHVQMQLGVVGQLVDEVEQFDLGVGQPRYILMALRLLDVPAQVDEPEPVRQTRHDRRGEPGPLTRPLRPLNHHPPRPLHRGRARTSRYQDASARHQTHVITTLNHGPSATQTTSGHHHRALAARAASIAVSMPVPTPSYRASWYRDLGATQRPWLSHNQMISTRKRPSITPNRSSIAGQMALPRGPHGIA
jgi:hypothetical protein